VNDRNPEGEPRMIPAGGAPSRGTDRASVLQQDVSEPEPYASSGSGAHP
jgi:hypothetical protein